MKVRTRLAGGSLAVAGAITVGIGCYALAGSSAIVPSAQPSAAAAATTACSSLAKGANVESVYSSTAQGEQEWQSSLISQDIGPPPPPQELQQLGLTTSTTTVPPASSAIAQQPVAICYLTGGSFPYSQDLPSSGAVTNAPTYAPDAVVWVNETTGAGEAWASLSSSTMATPPTSSEASPAPSS
jgi:hypothetical protein